MTTIPNTATADRPLIAGLRHPTEVVELERAHAFLRGGDTTVYVDVDPHGNVSLVCSREYLGRTQHFTLPLLRGEWGADLTTPDCPECLASGKNPDKQHGKRGSFGKSTRNTNTA